MVEYAANQQIESRSGAGAATEALGQAESFLEFQERLSQVARIDRPVLIIGERGTGKELAASRLHYLSKRWQEPLIALNCAALAPSLIEAELFGHEAGAFTGAASRRLGRFEAANDGTLFLDEIATIPFEAQEKILRVVEYGVFERVGGSEPVHTDVRIIGATNADLASMAQDGEFKSDLLDRLSFEVLFLPPLRERQEDIPLLARHFSARMAFEMGRETVPEFSEDMMQLMMVYPWPGNVRELKNVVERAVYRTNTEAIDEIVFNPFLSPYSFLPQSHKPEKTAEEPAEKDVVPHAADPLASKSMQEALQDVELNYLRAALRKTRYNQRQAAGLLDLTYNQFRHLYRKYKAQLQESSRD